MKRASLRAFLAGLALLILVSQWVPAAVVPQTRKVSVEALIYDLKHPDPERRRQAAVALGQNRVVSAVPALIELTADRDPQIRLEAVRALVQINDPKAVPAYTSLTRDSSRQVQEKAIEGIVQSYVVEPGGFFEGVKKVADFVNPFSDDYNPMVVEPYVTVDPKTIEALTDLLRDDDTSVRRQAALALGILRARSALPVIEDRLTTEADNGVRVELVRTVYKIGDPQAALKLIPLIHDDDKKVHDEAIFTVGRLRVKEAVEPLKKLYESGVEERKKIFKIVPVSGVDDLQKNLLQSLSYIGDPSCTEIFANSLADERDFYRRYGAEGLGRVGDSGYVTPLARTYLRENSDRTKLAISFALYRLGRSEHLDELVAHAEGDQAFNYLLELGPDELPKLYPYLGADGGVTARLLGVLGLRGDSTALPVAEKYTNSSDANVVSAANVAIRRLRARLGRG